MEKTSLDARYTGAWSEISTRIGARQNVISIYAAMAYPILGFALSNANYAKLCWLIIPSAVTCAILVKMHEEMIGNLHNFCRWCEHIGNLDGHLPSYHVETDPWCSINPKIRKQNDLILNILFNAPIIIGMALILWVNKEWFDTKLYEFIALVFICFAGACSYVFFTLSKIKKMRQTIYNQAWSAKPHFSDSEKF
ncbi:MAG: hypothetical protein ACRBCS_03765 [Cellvibrionaceae bacterium]